ncbi:MAG TPA: hypothetical protein VJN69_00370 [Candidatus Acidoferrales bacterium]|nr:hypothetical protein [Candidatus Acidoferrales bacterium]
MATESLRERLAHDVGLWLADGLVSKETHDLLRQRYGSRAFGIAKAMKSLGVAGGIVAFFGLLGLIGAASGSPMLIACLMFLSGAALTAAGIYLSSDKLGKYPSSSKVLLFLGVITATLGIGLAMNSLGLNSQEAVFVAGVLAIVPMGILAYRFKNSFLLYIALIEFFHWVGSWADMYGRSTYELAIDDPRLMSLAALAAVMIGILHERQWRDQTGRFYQAYQVMGLIYLNLSLLILSIDSPGGRSQQALWIGLWFVAALLQIVAGALLHNSLFTAFGVTVFAINVYTRYYENFWDHMHEGVFFLLGGTALFVVGTAFEVAFRRWQRRTA